jgi:hypothetical protein
MSVYIKSPPGVCYVCCAICSLVFTGDENADGDGMEEERDAHEIQCLGTTIRTYVEEIRHV